MDFLAEFSLGALLRYVLLEVPCIKRALLVILGHRSSFLHFVYCTYT